jgi:hypothetical protein
VAATTGTDERLAMAAPAAWEDRSSTELEISRHLLDNAAIDTRAPEAEAGEQGVVADDADRGAADHRIPRESQ